MTVGGPTITLSNGVKMPAVGLGTWQSKPEEVKNAVKVALEEGYRLIDTAAVYENEDAIGEALKEFLDSSKLKREDVFITTKAWTTHLHPDKIEKGIRESLKRLGLDYVDLYLAHMPAAFNDDMTEQDKSVTVEDVWRGLEGVYEKKLARAIGISNFNEEQTERIIKVAKVPIHNIQVELHLHLAQFGLEKIAKANNISITSYASLGSPGRVNFTLPSGAKLEWKPAPSSLDNPEVKALAEKYKKTPAQILLRLQLDRGLAVIPKSVTPSRIHENFQLFDFSLTSDDVASLLKVDQHPRLFGQDFMDGHPEDAFASER